MRRVPARIERTIAEVARCRPMPQDRPMPSAFRQSRRARIATGDRCRACAINSNWNNNANLQQAGD